MQAAPHAVGADTARSSDRRRAVDCVPSRAASVYAIRRRSVPGAGAGSPGPLSPCGR